MIKKSEAMIEKNVKKLLLLVRMINMWTYQWVSEHTTSECILQCIIRRLCSMKKIESDTERLAKNQNAVHISVTWHGGMSPPLT